MVARGGIVTTGTVSRTATSATPQAQDSTSSSSNPYTSTVASTPANVTSFYAAAHANPTVAQRGLVSTGSVVTNPTSRNQATNILLPARNSQSAVSQSNGSTIPPAQTATSTVTGYTQVLPITTPTTTVSTSLIPGIPDWLLFAGGALIVWVMLQPHK